MDVQIRDERAYGKLASKGTRDVIRDAYSEALRIENDQVNTEVSFIALGGDSFQAVKLYQRLQAEGLDISFQQILGQTIEEIVVALIADLEHLETSAALQHQAAGNSQSAGCGRFPMLDRDHDLGPILSALADRNLVIEDVESIYPASNMQESMYVAQQMGSEQNIIYQTRGLFSIPAEFDLWALNHTWTKIIERHQSLRTIFVETSGCSAGHLLDCVVLRDLPKSVPAVSEDFTCTTLEDVRKDLKIPCEDAIVDYAHRIKIYSGLNSETKRAFKRRQICKMEIPHMVVDGASLCILLDELRQGLLSNGAVFQELPLPAQYERYIEYNQEVQQRENAALDYWTEYLAGAVPCHVPSICAPPAAGGTLHNAANNSTLGSLPVVATGADNTLHLSVSYSDLRAFCRRQNATISNAIQAAWAVLLFTYTGQSDICYRYLASGRNVPIRGAAGIVGPMMNMLVSRVASIGSLSVGDIVTKIRDDFISSLPYQTVPLHKVQGLLGLGQARLFNTIVTSYFAPLMLLDDNAEHNPVRLLESHNASNFDLVVKAVYSDDDIRIRLVYSASALSAPAAKAVAKTFESILHKMTTTSGVDSKAVDSIDVISPEDHAFISEWNRKSCESVDEKKLKPACVHDLITDRARLQPLAPAVYAWDGSRDYQTLDKISTDVAL